MKLIEIIKNYIMFLIFAVCVSGCYTFNKSHNAAHNRVLKKDMELLHKDVDSFLGATKPSMLSE
ncbi:MAG: hypothetical protein AABY49_00315 [Planctomycetota bacterium]